MNMLAVLSVIFSLGLGASAWACDGKNQEDKKDKAAQSQAVEKNNTATTASAQNAQPADEKKNTPGK